MKFLKLEKINENQSRIAYIHYKPELLTEEEKKGGLFVEIVPEKEGFKAIYDHNLKKFIFEEDKETANAKKLEFEIETLKQAKVSLEEELATINYTLMMGGLV